MADRALRAGLAAAFEEDRAFLLGLLYRLTGSTADAEDLVQATFERALERPPRDTSRTWRPWLVRVAVNLGRDHLRRRRRRGYDGPWLPAPLETPERDLSHGVPEPATTEGRYALLESVSYAFLVALEALTPTQRAVLLLRDVFEYSGREAAEVLGLSEVGVRQHLSRARAAMARYDAQRERGVRGPSASAMRALLERFLAAIARGDVEAVASLLAEDVVLRSDGGGEFATARVDVVGRSKVARFFCNLARQGEVTRVGLRSLNGAPAVVTEVASPKPWFAPRVVTLATIDTGGRLAEIWSVLATPKLSGVLPLAESESLAR